MGYFKIKLLDKPQIILKGMLNFDAFIPYILVFLTLMMFKSCANSDAPDIKFKIFSDLKRIKRYENFDENINFAISGARNEWVGFQVAIRTEKVPLNNLTLTVSNFNNANGHIIDSSKFIRYREHFIKIDQSSKHSPLDPGWYPDALIPFVDPKTGLDLSGKYDASPYSLNPNENAVYYIEVLIPADVQSGIYQGQVKITWELNQSKNLYVILKVYDFKLPDQFIIPSLFGGISKRFQEIFTNDLSSAQKLFVKTLLDHRLEPESFYHINAEINMETGIVDFSEMQDKFRFLMDTMRLKIYRIPTGINWPFKKIFTSDKARFINFLKSYESFFIENNWKEKLCAYLIDEPNLRKCFYISYSGKTGYLKVADSTIFLYLDSKEWQINLNDSLTNTLESLYKKLSTIPGIDVSEFSPHLIPGINTYRSLVNQNLDLTKGGYVHWTQYELVRQIGEIIYEHAPSIKHFTTEQIIPTSPEWGSLSGSVDIWCPLLPLFEEASASKVRQNGNEVWIYTALCQKPTGLVTPYWQIDFPLLNYRLPFWLMYKFNISGILYWETTHWDISRDPWVHPISYIQEKDVYNGEGSLLYPAYDAGYLGLCSSLRLKTLRDGTEDYYYLQFADSLRYLNSQIDHVAKNWHDWNEDPNAILETRDKIARLIEKSPQTER